MSILELGTMRRRARKDANHDTVVRELRQAGFSVLETHQLGEDKPDLVVGGYGLTGLVELKPDGKSYTPDASEKARAKRQLDYLDAWAGDLAFVASSSADIMARFRTAALNDGRALQ